MHIYSTQPSLCSQKTSSTIGFSGFFGFFKPSLSIISSDRVQLSKRSSSRNLHKAIENLLLENEAKMQSMQMSTGSFEEHAEVWNALVSDLLDYGVQSYQNWKLHNRRAAYKDTALCFKSAVDAMSLLGEHLEPAIVEKVETFIEALNDDGSLLLAKANFKKALATLRLAESCSKSCFGKYSFDYGRSIHNRAIVELMMGRSPSGEDKGTPELQPSQEASLAIQAETGRKREERESYPAYRKVDALYSLVHSAYYALNELSSSERQKNQKALPQLLKQMAQANDGIPDYWIQANDLIKDIPS